MDELLEVIEYSFVDHYKNKTRFGLLQYFSLTDIMPIPLSKIALSKGKRSLARFLNKFDDQNYWNLNELDLEKKYSPLTFSSWSCCNTARKVKCG